MKRTARSRQYLRLSFNAVLELRKSTVRVLFSFIRRQANAILIENWKTFRAFLLRLYIYQVKTPNPRRAAQKSPPDNGTLNSALFRTGEVSMKITTVSVCVVCGILPLAILPVLPDTWILAVLFCLACLLCLILPSLCSYAALTLLFFMWGYLRRAGHLGGKRPACRDAGRRQSSLLPLII